jgi:hypothetical protein
MNASDAGKSLVLLHQSEAQRLLSWLKCYPVAGREDERKSLEYLLQMAISLSVKEVEVAAFGAAVACPKCGSHDRSLLLGACKTSVDVWHRTKMPKLCPRCESPAPHLHPAVQHEGEVQPCSHPFHYQVTPENTPERMKLWMED